MTTAGAMASIVFLDGYRNAVRAARFLRGCLHDPPWLRGVRVEAEAGGFRVAVLLAWQTPLLARCIPTSVNSVPVVQRVVG